LKGPGKEVESIFVKQPLLTLQHNQMRKPMNGIISSIDDELCNRKKWAAQGCNKRGRGGNKLAGTKLLWGR